MKIKKYRPAFFEGFEDVYYDVKTKEELFESELCKFAIERGGIICYAENKSSTVEYSCSQMHGSIMVVFQSDNEDGCVWYVLANIYNKKDADTLKSWLHDWYGVRKLFSQQTIKQD